MAAQKKSVKLIASAPVEVDGIRLPAGTYAGEESRIITHFMGKQQLLAADYSLFVPDNLLAGTINVLPGANISATQAVLKGDLKVV